MYSQEGPLRVLASLLFQDSGRALDVFDKANNKKAKPTTQFEFSCSPDSMRYCGKLGKNTIITSKGRTCSVGYEKRG